MVLAGFRSFQTVSHFSKYEGSQCWHRFVVLISV